MGISLESTPMNSRRSFLCALTGLTFSLLAGVSRRADGSVPRGAFLAGADLSELPCHEAQGVKYSDRGAEENLLVIARRNGWNVIRVRLWVHPNSSPEAAVSSLESVSAFGKRIKAAGFQFLLDMHYSDTWADPGHQTKPAAWDALTFPQLVQQVHDYSREVIAHLRQGGAMPDLVQIGNETRNGLLYGSGINGAGPQPGGGFWESAPGGRDRAVQLFAAGLAGVRAGASPAPVPRTILHVPDGQDSVFVRDYFRDLDASAKAQNVSLNYDIVGLSYYPSDPWDKKTGYDGWTLARLAASMNWVAVTLQKPVLIVETSWPQDGERQPIPGAPQFALTPVGQTQFYEALIRTVRAVPEGQGLGVIPWDQDSLNWNSVFDGQGRALPAMRALGQG